jgi:uncharacterized delta-60 repeat protein
MKTKLSLSFTTLLASVAISLTTQAGVPGRVDRSFQSALGDYGLPLHLDQHVSTMKRQADGKIIVAGQLTHPDSSKKSHLFRLNANGSLDTSFNRSGIGPDGMVSAVAVRGDGKILIGGAFNTYNGTHCGRIACLHPNGTLDETFSATSAITGGYITSILPLPSGKFIVAGDFGWFHDDRVSGLIRLNGNGSLDRGFTGHPDGAIMTATLLRDGNVMLGGAFTFYGGYRRDRLAKISASGELVIPTFLPGAGINGTVRAVRELPDGRVMVGGDFSGFLKCLSATGVPGAMPGLVSPGSPVYDLLQQRDGRIVIGSLTGLLRLHSTGLSDEFLSPRGMGYMVSALLQQPDGRLIVGGMFDSPDGVPSPFVARLDSTQASSIDFRGIATPDFWNQYIGGSLSITLSPTGSFTARVKVGTGTGSFTGRFNDFRNWSGTLGEGFGRMNITLTRDRSDAGSDVIYGELTGAFGTGRMVACPPYYDATYLPALTAQGLYNSTLAVEESSGRMPHGHNTLSWRVARSGAVTISGTLADGTAVTGSSILQPHHWCPVYVAMARNSETLCGLVAIFDRDMDINVWGDLYWTRTAEVTPTADARGELRAKMNLRGSDYDPALGYGFRPEAPTIYGSIQFTGGYIGAGTIGTSVYIHNNRRLSAPTFGPSVDALPVKNISISANPDTGVITGTCQVRIGDRYRSASLKGHIIQGDNIGFGSLRIPGATAAEPALTSQFTLLPVD